jgi:hypothetical protein
MRLLLEPLIAVTGTALAAGVAFEIIRWRERARRIARRLQSSR